MTQVPASRSPPAPRTPSLIAQTMAVIRTQIRGLAEVLSFLVAGAAALWALLSGLLASARAQREVGAHLGKRLAPFPVDD